MPREQVRGANRQKRVASVTHSSRLLLPNPRNLPPTRHHPPPARRYPSRVTRFLAPLEAGSLDGPKNEAANCFRCAASSRRRAALAVYRRRRTRGISVGVARHFRTRPGARRADTARPACRQRERSDFRLGRDDRLGRGRRNSPTPLFPAKHLIQRPRFSEPARGISRRELVSPVTRVPLPLSPVRASDPQQPSASPPPRARPNRVPRTHERSR